MEQETNNTVLIHKYLLGEATEAEALELKQLLDTDEAVKKEYLELKRVVELSETNEVVQQIDAKAEFAKFKGVRPARNETKVIPISQGMQTMKIVLRVAALIVLGACLWYVSSQESTLPILAEATTDKKVEKVLTDGSIITINANSKLSYPEQFAADVRLVELVGEAYFEVESNKNQPFIIAVGNSRIKVTGTKFNVNANNPDSIVVTVKKGSVLFYNLADEAIATAETHGLTADKKGTLMANNSAISFETNDHENYLYWQDGRLRFRNSPLKDIVKKLNSEWNLNLVLNNPKVEECKLTVSFDQDDDILQLLEITLDISIEKVDGKVIISGDGC